MADFFLEIYANRDDYSRAKIMEMFRDYHNSKLSKPEVPPKGTTIDQWCKCKRSGYWTQFEINTNLCVDCGRMIPDGNWTPEKVKAFNEWSGKQPKPEEEGLPVSIDIVNDKTYISVICPDEDSEMCITIKDRYKVHYTLTLEEAKSIADFINNHIQNC